MSVKLVGVVGAARMLGVSPRTLQSWRSDRKGPSFYRIGGTVRYDVNEIRRWLESKRVEFGDADRDP